MDPNDAVLLEMLSAYLYQLPYALAPARVRVALDRLEAMGASAALLGVMRGIARLHLGEDWEVR